MSRPKASAAGLECYEYEWMEETDLLSRPAVAAVEAGLESFWIQEPDLSPQGMEIASLLCSEQAPSDSIWEWKGHADLVFSRGDLGPPLGNSPKSNTKFSMMVEDDKPPTILPKPNSAGVTSTKGEKYPTCGICFKEHGPLCPYFDYVPPGATVGPGYSVICHGCCHYISMPSWICNNCGGKIRAGKVIIKHCIICKSNYQHESADCPHDKDKAAECRWIREVDRSKKYTPWVPNYVPRTPIPQELW